MSAPDVANSERKASGIWSRKSLKDGWSRTLGQTATYIATSSTRATDQPSRPRRWSYRVLVKMLRSIIVPRPVVAEEGFLQRGRRACEVLHRPCADLLEQGVERLLRGAAGQHPSGDGQVPDAGDAGEIRGRDVLAETRPHPVQRLRGEVLQPLDRDQPPVANDADPVRDAFHLAEHMRREQHGASSPVRGISPGLNSGGPGARLRSRT